MAEYDYRRIYKPPYFSLSPLAAPRVSKPFYIMGFDSEAENGYPFLYQVSHPDGRTDLLEVPEGDRPWETMLVLLDYLHDNCKRQDVEYVLFGFNLAYEYTQLFRDLPPEGIISDEFRIGNKDRKLGIDQPSFLDDGTPFYIKAANIKRYYFTVEFGRGKRRIKVVDAMAFFPMSLDKAAKAIGAGAKLPKPSEFSRAASHTPEFIAYATQDANLTRLLGDYIVELHHRYDVSLCISAPQFAAKVFRRAYLKTGIKLAHPAIEQAGLDSYHGGKNGFYLRGPSYLTDMWHVDIRSAYPEAMRQLPDTELGEWKLEDRYTPGAHALWTIKGTYKPCKYRCLLGRKSWLKRGEITTTITGYELDTALSHEELELRSCVGWVFTGPEGGALTEYVDSFYALKRYADNPASKAAAKLFLNSLYGKFFQKVPNGIVGNIDYNTGAVILTDPDEDYDWTAGGLYHPPIASLITGYVRAKIHGLEHKYESVMTSTDGFFARKPPTADAIGEELGQLSAEKGTLRIWRERLYVFDAEDGSVVAAMHGFRGSIAELRRIPLVANILPYMASSMTTLRMSLRRMRGTRHAPGTFVEEQYLLDLRARSP